MVTDGPWISGAFCFVLHLIPPTTLWRRLRAGRQKTKQEMDRSLGMAWMQNILNENRTGPGYQIYRFYPRQMTLLSRENGANGAPCGVRRRNSLKLLANARGFKTPATESGTLEWATSDRCYTLYTATIIRVPSITSRWQGGVPPYRPKHSRSGVIKNYSKGVLTPFKCLCHFKSKKQWYDHNQWAIHTRCKQ